MAAHGWMQLQEFPSQVTPCPGNSSIHRPVNWGKMALTVGLNLGHLRGASAAPERLTASAEAPQCTYPSSTALCPVPLPSLHRGCSWENVQGAVYVETSALVSSSLGTQQEILPDHQNVSCFKLNRPWITLPVFHWNISDAMGTWTCTPKGV